MNSRVDDLINARIKALYERGVFQGFSHGQLMAGKKIFRFRWLMGKEFILEYDSLKGVIKVKDLLPNVENSSLIDKELRAFIAGRASESLPAHRRVNLDRVTLIYTNRKQLVSLTAQVNGDQYDYAITRLLRVISDLFSYMRLYHVSYLYQHFDLPEE